MSFENPSNDGIENEWMTPFGPAKTIFKLSLKII